MFLVLVLVAMACGPVIVCGDSASGAPIDETLSSEAGGAAVVEMVCARLEASCIFPDDKLFLRRLAFVQSADGTSPDTYAKGYYGGIWKVTFSYLRTFCSIASYCVHKLFAN